MFLDWHPDLDLGDYRFVIVGAGIAGLYLARSLAPAGKVLVVEAGNAEDPLSSGEPYYDLTSTGRPYPVIGSRLAAFGGTSNHWGGNSHPISPEIFEPQSGSGGWPIPYSDFAAHLDAAGEFLNLKPFGGTPDPSSIESGILAGYDDLLVRRFQFSKPALRLGDPDHVAAFAAEPAIHILTDTRLADLDLSPGGSSVASMTLLHRPSRQRLTGPPRQLILCAGGIENARLLLWAARKYTAGNPLAGGPNRLTGTHFSDKPYFSPVEIFLDARADLSDAVPRDGVHGHHHAWELSSRFRAAHDLPRFGVFPESPQLLAAPPADLSDIANFYLGRSSSYVRIEPSFQFEQTPNARSYVALDTALDPDGIARPLLNWNIIPEDIATYRKATLAFCAILTQRGFAKARLKPLFRYKDWSTLDLGRCNHHIGTTRMGASPLDGVVDADCRVFGVDNLFVAGSSVFPVADYVNPTLSLVALAGRLAAHLVGNDGVLR